MELLELTKKLASERVLQPKLLVIATQIRNKQRSRQEFLSAKLNEQKKKKKSIIKVLNFLKQCYLLNRKATSKLLVGSGNY